MDVARAGRRRAAPVAVPESALKGAGVTIAVVDSGVALHPDIQTLVAAVDFVGNRPAALRGRSRPRTASTRTATARTWPASWSATAATRRAAAWPAWRPQANLVSVRVLDGTGRGLTSDVLAGLQWILDHKDEYGIRVVNLSLGHPVFEPAAVDPLVQAVDALWDAGRRRSSARPATAAATGTSRSPAPATRAR